MDVFKPRGQTKASKPDAGGATTRSVPVLGVVKDNIDPSRSGRIRVYIADFGASDPDDSNAWVTVGYMSPFFGQTEGSGPTTGYGDFKKNPASYGMWTSPPDIGSVVVCIFIKGDPNFGYYIGCLPNPEALHMVPAIGASEDIVANEGEANSYGGATRLPVTNINANNKDLADSAKFLSAAKPVHSYSAAILAQQGLIRDPIRGPITTSAQRESPSRVGFGVSTPGRPIYEGGFTDETVAEAASKSDQESNLKIVSRRGGHTFVMDDGDILGRDQLVRLRTTLGHQILMSDSGQTLFIIHANGQSWIELGKEGTIDMYATNSVNIRSQGDLNLHADNNVNIQASKSLNISANEGIQIETEKDMKFRSGGSFNNYTIGSYTVKVDGRMSMGAAGEASYASGSATFINGSKINLNTGSASLVPAEVPQLSIVAHTDTLNDSQKGWIAAPGKLLSIVSRAPAHAPWSAAGQAVDVKTSGSAADNLPSNPSTEIAQTNDAVSSVEVTPVTSAVISSVPPVAAVSDALDKNITSALVGQTAVLAATGIAKDAVAAGMGVVETPAGKVASIGQLAQTPSQLEAAGIIKPGAAGLVNSLVQGGKSVEQALTSNLFTGKQGAETLDKFVNNTPAQVNVAVTNMQQAQKQLTAAGVITGKESGTQISGLIMSTATQGVQNTVNFIKNAASSVSGVFGSATSAISGAANNLLGPVNKMLSAGNTASNFAESATSGLSSIAGAISKTGTSALGGLQGLATAAKGAAAAAFASIVSGLPKIAAGVPQNLKKIVDTASNAIGNKNTGSTGIAGMATGLNTMIGGEKTVANIVNNATSSISTSIPGVSVISGLVKSPGAILDKLKNGTESLSSLVKSGMPASVSAQLNSAISAVTSGGSSSIQLPKVATNTFDRTALSNQIGSALGDPKIPKPNFSGNPATFGETPATAAVAVLQAKVESIGDINKLIADQAVVVDNARVALANAKSDLPAGDPKVNALKVALIAESDKLATLRKQADTLAG